MIYFKTLFIIIDWFFRSIFQSKFVFKRQKNNFIPLICKSFLFLNNFLLICDTFPHWKIIAIKNLPLIKNTSLLEISISLFWLRASSTNYAQTHNPLEMFAFECCKWETTIQLWEKKDPIHGIYSGISRWRNCDCVYGDK